MYSTAFLLLLSALRDSFRGRAALQLELIALRHQLVTMKRISRRPSLRSTDRMLWVLLSRLLPNWRETLVIVKPETVIGWHRKGFRLYWTWKSRRRIGGRPPVPREVRDLIRRMNRENPLWGAPRIHGELLKLGIEVSQATVSKYMSSFAPVRYQSAGTTSAWRQDLTSSLILATTIFHTGSIQGTNWANRPRMKFLGTTG